MANSFATSSDTTVITRVDGSKVVLLERAGHVCGCCGMWMHPHACYEDGQESPGSVVARLRQSASAYACEPGAARLVTLLRAAAQLLEDRTYCESGRSCSHRRTQSRKRTRSTS